MVKETKPQNPLMFTITNWGIREGWMIEIAFLQFVWNSNAKSYRNSDTLLTISIYFCLLGGPANSTTDRVSTWKRKPTSEMASRHGLCNTLFQQGTPRGETANLWSERFVESKFHSAVEQSILSRYIQTCD